MSNVGHYHPFGGGIAAQLVRDDHTWSMASGPQQFPEKTHSRESITLPLHENIDHDSMLIDGSPEIVGNAVDLEEDLIQMPLVAGPSPTSSQATSELLAKLIAPAPNRFIAEEHSAGSHHLFHISEAHPKAKIQPHAIRDDLVRKPMATVWAVRHSSSIPSAQPANVTMPF